MAKVSSDLTVAELQRILNARQAALRELRKQRAKIQKELEKIDADIRAQEGGSSHSRNRRTRNPRSLRVTVLELLEKNKKGYSLAELSSVILESGYKTTSTNFRNVLYQCLYNTSGIYHDEASGTYRYKKPEPKGGQPAIMAPVGK